MYLWFRSEPVGNRNIESAAKSADIMQFKQNYNRTTIIAMQCRLQTVPTVVTVQQKQRQIEAKNSLAQTRIQYKYV